MYRLWKQNFYWVVCSMPRFCSLVGIHSKEDGIFVELVIGLFEIGLNKEKVGGDGGGGR